MLLHDAVGVNVKIEHLLKIKAKVSSVWAKSCMLEDCVIRLHMTTPPWWREKVWNIIINTQIHL